MRRITIVFAALALAGMLAAGQASAALKVGTDGADTLVGTKYADHLTGKRGDDVLEGRAGNDVYHFADGFGTDTLVEPKKAGRLPGGVDTISFSDVTTRADIFLIPQYRVQGYYRASTADSNGVVHRVDLVSSAVEKAVGGTAGDSIYTGAGANTLKGGAGGNDFLANYGGWDGISTLPGLPASDDVYGGFAAGSGGDYVVDYGGAADVLDLRPWDSSEVYVDALSMDGSDPSNDSLIVATGGRGVLVYGHFAPILNQDENGTMEKIVFANETITSAPEVRALVADSAGEVDGTVAKAEALAPPQDLLGPNPQKR